MKKLFTLLLVALVGMLPSVAETATFDFEDLTTLTPTPSDWKSGGPNQPSYIQAEDTEYSAGNASILLPKTNATCRFQKQSNSTWLLFNAGAKININAKEGYVIKSITFTANSSTSYGLANLSTKGEGTYANPTYTAPEAGETTVTFSTSMMASKIQFAKIEVVLEKVGGGDVPQNEESTFDFVNNNLNPATEINAKWPERTFLGNKVDLTVAHSSSGTYLQKGSLRVQTGTTFTFKSAAGYSIESIFFGFSSTSSYYTKKLEILSGGGTYDYNTATYTAIAGGTKAVSFTYKETSSFLTITVKLIPNGEPTEPEAHVPAELSYVLNGGEAVAMTKMAATNVELAAGATLSFTDPDGYAYGAEAAGATLVATLSTQATAELTEYAPADAANVKTFTVKDGGTYNIAVKFKDAVGTLTLTKVAEPLVDSNKNSVATFNWSQPGSLSPAMSEGTFFRQTFTANGVTAEVEPNLGSEDARFKSSNGTTVLRLYAPYEIKITAPAGKVIYNVKIGGGSASSSNTSIDVPASTNSANGVYTILPSFETDKMSIKILGSSAVEFSYMTVTYANAYVPSELNYVTNGNNSKVYEMTADKATKSFTATEVMIGEWEKDGSIKFTESTMSFMFGFEYSCGAPKEGEVAEIGKAMPLYGAEELDEKSWYNYSVAPGIYTVTVSFASGAPTMTLTKTAEIPQPKPTTMYAIISGLEEPLQLMLMGNDFLANDVTVGTTMGQTFTAYFAESEDITNGRTYGAAEADQAYDFSAWTVDLTEFAAGATPNKFKLPAGIYNFSVNITNDTFKLHITQQGDVMPAMLNVYNGSELKEMTADTEAKKFTITDYQVGEWGKDGSIKFTSAFMNMMFGEAYACGAATEGEAAEAGTAYTMTGKDKLPTAEWFAYTVAPGIYTIEVSYATGKAVMTLTKTGDIKQPKPTTMYALFEGLAEPLELMLMGNSFLANDVTMGTVSGLSVSLYFAEDRGITTGRTWGAAENNAPCQGFNVPLTEYAAGVTPNSFNVPKGIYTIDVNITNDVYTVTLTKTGDIMPLSLNIYNSESLKEMTPDFTAKTFTLTDYQVGEWGKDGSIKFTTAFMDLAFGQAYACGAATEGETAVAGTAYTMTAKDNMPTSEWFAYTVAPGIYTVEVSFATGKPVMTLTQTGEVAQPKPTTMYVVSDGLTAPVELTLMGNSFLSGEDITLGTTPDETVTVYFAENADAATGRTWGAATADEPYDFTKWTVDLTEAAAGTEANVFTLPAAIYKFDVNIGNDTFKVRISKQGELSGLENIEAAEADVEYYNLQGVRVANPTTGVYIRVQGNKATKVSIR